MKNLVLGHGEPDILWERDHKCPSPWIPPDHFVSDFTGKILPKIINAEDAPFSWWSSGKHPATQSTTEFESRANAQRNGG